MTRTLADESDARQGPSGPSSEARVRKEVRGRVWRIVAFVGHAAVWAMVCLFLAVVAGSFPAIIVGLGWGIGLVAHGVFGLLGPELRHRWVQAEVERRMQRVASDERRAAASEHDRSLGELAASVAHEIRNPVAAAKSLVQQMAEDPASEHNAEYGRTAAEELDRVERAVAHLLRFAREEPARSERVGLSEVVESALETFHDRIGESVRVERELDPGCELQGDPEKLRRVAINLVSNALDALDQGATGDPQLRLACGRSLAGDEVWLSVRDNGPGIERERVDRIFSPFETSKPEGTGLGLAIAKKTVDHHGGHLEVTSTPGQGTEFVLAFPAYGAEEGERT